jgi:hypothetical protein
VHLKFDCEHLRIFKGCDLNSHFTLLVQETIQHEDSTQSNLQNMSSLFLPIGVNSFVSVLLKSSLGSESWHHHVCGDSMNFTSVS